MTDDLVKRNIDQLRLTSGELADLFQQLADAIEALTAERDSYRKVLEDIIADCEADYPPSHGAIKYAAHAALKGESQ